MFIEVNRLSLAKGNAKEIAFYWFKVGDTFTPNYWKQQALIALKTLFGKPASSALIRLSADVFKNDEASAAKRIKEFANLAIPEMFKYLP